MLLRQAVSLKYPVTICVISVICDEKTPQKRGRMFYIDSIQESFFFRKMTPTEAMIAVVNCISFLDWVTLGSYGL